VAGSGALIEHGIADRPTDDADLFSTFEHAESFCSAADAVVEALERQGFVISEIKRSETFFQFGVAMSDGEIVEVDMSLDWRRYNPAEIAIGPVLNIHDAAAAKVAPWRARSRSPVVHPSHPSRRRCVRRPDPRGDEEHAERVPGKGSRRTGAGRDGADIGLTTWVG